MKIIKFDHLQSKLSKSIAEKVWDEISELKSIIETKEKSSAPYNRTLVTTSIWLSGDQILMGLTPKSLQELIERAIYEAFNQGKNEYKDIADLKNELKSEKDKLQYQLNLTEVKNLQKQIDFLQAKLAVWEKAAEESGYTYE